MTKEELINLWSRDRNFSDKLIKAYFSVPKENFVHYRHHDDIHIEKQIPTHSDYCILKPTDMMLLLHNLDIKKDDKILEIGTGSGYIASIMSKLARRVISVEILEDIHNLAKENIKKIQRENIDLYIANGKNGYIPEFPYDKIISTVAFDEIPEIIINQLSENGIFICPLKDGLAVEMIKLTKNNNRISQESIGHFII